jgi:hypothetical protein
MLRLTQLSLWVLLAVLTGIANSEAAEQDPRLLQRPTVAKPLCSNPTEYRIDSWTPEAPDFVISLRPAIVDSAREAERLTQEAERLAQKYRFKFIVTDFQTQAYFLGVAWLEPEQVAAIRCESSVLYVGFKRTVVVSTPHQVGHPLQRP